MARSDYIAANDDTFAGQLQTFKNVIGAYTGTLGVTPDQVDAQAADADYFSYAVTVHDIMRNGAQQWTSWKNLQRHGGTAPATGTPSVPTFPPVVDLVQPGIEERFRALAKAIKSSPNYNTSIGEALGIEGPERTGPDLATVQPNIEASVSGSEVQVKWSWGGKSAYLDMCELQVDRADGKGFVMLAFDTTPNYTDTTPFPSAPAKWTYQAIYRVGDHRVGQWSKPVSVTVGG